MTYGLERVLPVEIVLAPDARLAAGQVPWRKLDEQSRLRLVERQLKSARPMIDGFPLAL